MVPSLKIERRNITMNKILKTISDNKLKVAGVALNIIGLGVQFLSANVESKQLEESVNQIVDNRIATIANGTENVEEEKEGAQND